MSIHSQASITSVRDSSTHNCEEFDRGNAAKGGKPAASGAVKGKSKHGQHGKADDQGEKTDKTRPTREGGHIGVMEINLDRGHRNTWQDRRGTERPPKGGTLPEREQAWWLKHPGRMSRDQ